MNHFVFFFYDEIEKQEYLFHKNTLFEGFYWCIKVLGQPDSNSNINNGKVILRKITCNERVIFQSDTPISTHLWEHNSYVFLDNNFLDKSNDKLASYFPREGWQEGIDIVDDFIMIELVDSNYKFIENNFYIKDLNYAKNQVYCYVKKWVEKLIEVGYFRTKDNIPIFLNFNQNTVELNDLYYMQAFELYYKVNMYLTRLKQILKVCESLPEVVGQYMNAPFYMSSHITGKVPTDEDAKYKEIIYKTFVSEINK